MRRKKDHCQNSIDQIVTCRPDPSVSLDAVGKHSSQRVLAKRRCKIHYAHLTAQAINRSNRSLGCPLCPGAEGRGAATGASRYAKRADKLVRSYFPGATFITEARWLKNFSGGMDMTVEGTNSWGQPFSLDIEIDGEQHFRKPFRNRPIYLQREIDKRKDRLAQEQGRRLLRLHFADNKSWGKHISAAKERVNREPDNPWLMRTPSYVKLALYLP